MCYDAYYGPYCQYIAQTTTPCTTTTTPCTTTTTPCTTTTTTPCTTTTTSNKIIIFIFLLGNKLF